MSLHIDPENRLANLPFGRTETGSDLAVGFKYAMRFFNYAAPCRLWRKGPAPMEANVLSQKE